MSKIPLKGEGQKILLSLCSLKIEYQHTFYLPSVVRKDKLQERTHEHYVPSGLWRCDSTSERKPWQTEVLMILAFFTSAFVRSTEWWDSNEVKCMTGRCVPTFGGVENKYEQKQWCQNQAVIFIMLTAW